VFSFSKYLIVLYIPFLWWHEMTQLLCDEMNWGEWHWHGNMPRLLYKGYLTQALQYHHGGSDNQGSYWVGSTIYRMGKGMIPVPGQMKQESKNFHHDNWMASNLKFKNCLFQDFLLNIFRLQLTMGTWNHENWNHA
jgi:hypothetical protein